MRGGFGGGGRGEFEDGFEIKGFEKGVGGGRGFERVETEGGGLKRGLGT